MQQLHLTSLDLCHTLSRDPGEHGESSVLVRVAGLGMNSHSQV